MSIGKLIRHFEGIGKVPVSITDVLREVRANLPNENVHVTGVDLPANILRGIHYRYIHQPLPDSMLLPADMAMVLYSLQQPTEWQRFVCCKELVHLFDSASVRTDTREDVVRLGQKISGKGDFGKISSENLQWFFDELAKYQALAIMFPFNLREEVNGSYEAGRVTDDMLVEAVRIPVEYVRMVMDDRWKALRESILVD